MHTTTLKISDITSLNDIVIALRQGTVLTKKQKEILISFLNKLPPADKFLGEGIALDVPVMAVQLLNINRLTEVMEKWENLFLNLPGHDNAISCVYWYELESLAVYDDNIVLAVVFHPTMDDNKRSFEKGDSKENDREIPHPPLHLYLMVDGTARFRLHTVYQAEKYHELYTFKGIWKEAYWFLIEIMRKGWPQEEFPEELQKFLPKEQ
jgi:hypothetical protein